MNCCGGGVNLATILATIISALCLMIAPFWALQDSNEENDTDFTISNRSVSFALDTSPTLVPNIVMVVGALLLIVVSFAREVQLRMLFSSVDAYSCCVRGLNVLNSILLVGVGIGFAIAAVFDSINFPFLHLFGAILGIAGSIIYEASHIVLTFMVRCLCRLEFDGPSGCLGRYAELVLLVPLWLAATVNILVFSEGQVTSAGDIFLEDGRFLFEWIALWIVFVMFGIKAVFFARNPIGPEFASFCCSVCCSCCNRGGTGDQDDPNQMEIQMA